MNQLRALEYPHTLALQSKRKKFKTSNAEPLK